jgi:two-component system, NtrC family, response regulator AlgB
VEKPAMAKLLVVDDDRKIRQTLSAYLETFGHEVRMAESAREALDLLAAFDFDLVLTDHRMAERTGLELLQDIRQRFPDLIVILMTAYATVEGAVGAMKAGAYDYVTKPFSPDQLQRVLERALEIRSLRGENRALRDTVDDAPSLESRSPAMRILLEAARQAAASDATILLIGESGVGKNVLARQIHRWSARGEKPFVTVNCTTISEHLLESELFGHMRGAFTGAIKDKPGRLEAADGGTVFLDEIADLEADLQTKFLRFVQDQSFERVGGDSTIRVDVRIIAASNRDLIAEVAAHRFREDLFYRLNVITLRVPALREHAADILPLANRMLSGAAARNHRGELQFSPEACEALTRYPWHGNVRELRNAVERATVLSHGEVITAEYLPDALFREPSTIRVAPTAASLERIEREHIMHVLAESPTLEDAAATLGINVSTLWRKRKRYRLDSEVHGPRARDHAASRDHL